MRNFGLRPLCTLLLCLWLVTPSQSKKGDWVSSGAPVADPPTHPLLKCRDPQGGSYRLLVRAWPGELSSLTHGRIHELSGVLEFSPETPQVESAFVTITRTGAPGRLYRMDLTGELTKSAESKLPRSFYFRQVIGRQKIPTYVLSGQDYTNFALSCRATWTFLWH